jgi:hypothetical protein
MAFHTYRLAIHPERAPEVRRVIDFDGRCSLHDVHRSIAATLELADDDHLYAFYLSGRYRDKTTEYGDPRRDGRRADKALLGPPPTRQRGRARSWKCRRNPRSRR